MALLSRLLTRAQAQVAPPIPINNIEPVGSLDASAIADNIVTRLGNSRPALAAPSRSSSRRRAEKAPVSTDSCRVQLNIQVSPELRDQLHAIAKQRGVRLGVLVAGILGNYVRRQQQ